MYKTPTKGCDAVMEDHQLGSIRVMETWKVQSGQDKNGIRDGFGTRTGQRIPGGLLLLAALGLEI